MKINFNISSVIKGVTTLALVTIASTDMNAQAIVGTYSIQNIKTGKDLRPRDPRYTNGIPLVQYTHHPWKCLTWDFSHIAGNTYLLTNLYSHNTFEAGLNPVPGANAWHKPIMPSALQRWEFLFQADGTYAIRLEGTGLYLTTTSCWNNSNIVLMPRANSANQAWRLIKQEALSE